MAGNRWVIISWQTCAVKAIMHGTIAEAKRMALKVLPTMPRGTLLGIEATKGAAERVFWLVEGEWLDANAEGAAALIRAELVRIGAPKTYAEAAEAEGVRPCGTPLERHRALVTAEAARAAYGVDEVARALTIADARTAEVRS